MKFNLRNWFSRRVKDRDYSGVESFMNQINADISSDVRSILSSLSPQEEKELKELYLEISRYRDKYNEINKISLINNKFILGSIAVNASNCVNLRKIFDFVKCWDNETYLPKGIGLVLNKQISKERITELEDIYKKYNVSLKAAIKDKNNFYYINSLRCKEELAISFGEPTRTFALSIKIKEIDNGKKITKYLMNYLDEMLVKKDVDGRIINKILFYKIRDIDNDYVTDSVYLKKVFGEGLVDSGNVLVESNTTREINDIYEALNLLKANDRRYSGILVIEIPNIYFNKGGLLPEYRDKVFIHSDYQMINPSYIKGYIATGIDRCELYTKKEILNQELDLPDLKE